jgi:hypothetical protein
MIELRMAHSSVVVTSINDGGNIMKIAILGSGSLIKEPRGHRR